MTVLYGALAGVFTLVAYTNATLLSQSDWWVRDALVAVVCAAVAGAFWRLP